MNEHPPEWVPYTTRPERPSFWRTVGLSLSAVWQHRYVCLVLALPYAALFTLPAQTVEIFGSGSSGLPSGTGLELDEVIVLGALFVAVSGTLLLASLLVYPATLGAISLVGTAALFGEPVELGGILRSLGERVFAVVGTFLLATLATFAAPVVAVLAALVVAAATESGAAALVTVALVAASFVFAVVLLVRFLLAIPAAIVEGAGPVAALRRSWELVRGGVWRIVGVLLVLNLFAGLVGSALSLLGQVAEQLGIVGGQGVGAFVIAASVGMVVTILATAVTGVGAGVLYAGQVVLHADEEMASSADPVEPPAPRPETPPPTPQASPLEPPRPEGPVPPQEDSGSA